MAIPKKLHRVLVRGYDPGAVSARWWARFAELHPAWELVTWDDSLDPADFELGRLFESCTSGAQLADLIRIEVLWKFGGVYVDTDVEPLAPLDPLLDIDCFLGTEDGATVSIGVMGAVAGHAVFRALMDRLLEYDSIPGGFSARQTTGPLFYSRMLDLRDDVVVLPREVFYPYNPYIGIDRDGTWSTRHSICVHHWAATWAGPALEDQPAPSVARRAKQVARNAVRTHAYPVLRRVVKQVIDAPSRTYGVYVGDNRVLISTTDGFRMHSVANDLSLTPELVSRGWYDDKLLQFLDGALRPGDWFVDVGSNIGLFTLAAARRVGRWGHVVAFEADPELAEICQGNVGMNWLRNVEVIAGAAGRAPGQIEFSRHRQYRMLSVAGSDEHEDRGVREGFDVVAVPVHRVDNELPPGTPVRVVKIDVEGGEADVLHGMSRLVEEGLIDYIVVEVIRGNAASRWFALLEHLGTFVEVQHARLWTLDYRGRMVAITLQEVSVLESLSQLVVDFTD